MTGKQRKAADTSTRMLMKSSTKFDRQPKKSCGHSNQFDQNVDGIFKTIREVHASRWKSFQEDDLSFHIFDDNPLIDGGREM